MIRIGRPEFEVVLDEDLGGEIVHIGPAQRNVLARYDWRSPISAGRSSSYDAGGALDWLSDYRGGWQTLAPNAGDPCTVDGVPLPFHGEWSRTRVDVAQLSDTAVTFISGLRLPFILERTVEVLPSASAVRVRTTLTNDGTADAPFVWGEHPALALGPGAKLVIPAGRVEVHDVATGPHSDLEPGSSSTWPHGTTSSGEVDLSTIPETEAERLCYLVDVEQPWAAALDADVAIGLSWDSAAYPHLWFWQEQGGPGFPWYGRSAITAIEPAAHWPSNGGLQGAIERGQARFLAPGESASAWACISVSPWDGRNPVGVDAEGNITYEGVKNV